MLESEILRVSNLTGEVKEKFVDFIVADIAFRVFLSKYVVGVVPEIWYTVTVVGSNELDVEKSITSSIINSFSVLLDEIEVFSGIIKA